MKIIVYHKETKSKTRKNLKNVCKKSWKIRTTVRPCIETILYTLIKKDNYIPQINKIENHQKSEKCPQKSWKIQTKARAYIETIL